MKYVNATVGCYKNVEIINDSIASISVPFDRVVSFKSNDKIYIGNFFVVTDINILGTRKDSPNRDSILDKGNNLSVTIRLTKCDSDENNRRYKDLDVFVIDLEEEKRKNNIHKACFKFLNYKRFTEIEPFALPLGSGAYVIKVIVSEINKEGEKGKETIQSMNYLRVLDN